MSFRFQVTLSKDAGSLRRTQSGAIFSIGLLPNTISPSLLTDSFSSSVCSFQEKLSLCCFHRPPSFLAFLLNEYFPTLL